ncbi:MAG: CYTH domain-containing protein [Rhodocyclaceae bacterium]|jgi:inorganic triphosphatase YgiF|nr:CYTH domain-containing protein [Rhodocyclaceae bacterium]MBK6905706.1 CYTH domain-containing protein [Rhodocyclaceae bacterium]
MSEEIELKLSIAPADHRRFMAHPLLRQAVQRTDQMLDNQYFDTPDHALRQRGVAVRLRRQGRLRLQTIKLASSVATANGLSIRPEWEDPFRGRFDFSMIEVPEIRKWLQQPDIAERIVPLFQTRFRRVTWHLPIAERGLVLVQLDRGFVAARCGEREQREAISEIELELAGSEDAAVLTEIAGQLGQRIRLEPSDTSKSRRGYVLLDAVTGI